METFSHLNNQLFRELTENEAKAIGAGRKQWVKLVLNVLEYIRHANDMTRHKPDKKHTFN